MLGWSADSLLYVPGAISVSWTVLVSIGTVKGTSGHPKRCS